MAESGVRQPFTDFPLCSFLVRMHSSFLGSQFVEGDVFLDHSCAGGRAGFQASAEGSPEQRDILWAAGVGVAVGEPTSHPDEASQSQAGWCLLAGGEPGGEAMGFLDHFLLLMYFPTLIRLRILED